MKWPEPIVVVVARVQAALPILVVAALSGYTWWLVQSTPKPTDQHGSEAPMGVPDYVLGRATVERFDAQGRTVSVLQGQSIEHVPSGDRVLVDGMRLSALDTKGQLLQAHAARGDYSGDSALVRLQGQAQVVITPAPTAHAQGPVVFEGEAFSINTDTRVLHSDKPVRLRSEQGVVQGASLHHDARAGVSVLGGRVSGHLQSSQASPSP
jgi:lipopolysaccharide export system protein LptC